MKPSSPPRFATRRASAWLRFALPAALFVACVSADHVTAPRPGASPRLDGSVSPTGGVVISQIYGGGGNAGATLKNDFIELYNAGTSAVSLTGWSVQYASATGTSWQVTTLSGSIASGHYYLIKEAAGAGGTVDLPAADATGAGSGIPMSATAGKVALLSSTSALSVACPTGGALVDFVGFGSTANCFEGSNHTGAPSNTNAALRKGDGFQDTNDNAADFTIGAPNPRNSSFGGGSGTPAGPYDHAVVSGASTVDRNSTITLTAALQDADDQSISDPAATYVWSSSDESIAKVTATSGNTATIKGIAVGGPVTISVDATSGGVTKSATKEITVTQPPAGHVTIGVGTNPLVIGYQTQLFVNGGSADQSGNLVTSDSVTWSTSNPAIITVDSRGVISAAGDGSATLTGTSRDGSAGSVTVTTEVPIYSTTARAGHNTEFGSPADADASNDVIIARKQYTVSYNPQRGGPNWVSWDLSASHLGSRDRCNCYSADTALARLGYGQYMYNTADYTNGGYDRGHMEPSADQTTTDGENATTFFLTNFLPQTHSLNAGPWERLESALRDSVRAGREAYVIAGGIFTNGVGLGSLKHEGKIFVPDSTWKIVVMVPAGTGLSEVNSATDLDVFAVNMPNDSAHTSSDWTEFTTTVQKIQQSTGYDFLASLPEAIECRVEVRNCAPTSAIAPVSGAVEGSAVTFDASGSADADGDGLTYGWSFGDGSTGTGVAPAHTYVDNGQYTVAVTVTDGHGGSSTSTRSVAVANALPAPTMSPSTTTVRVGVPFNPQARFTDAGSHDATWHATIAWGDGTSLNASLLTQPTTAIRASKAYSAPGTYVVRFTVTDKDGGSAFVEATVTVTP